MRTWLISFFLFIGCAAIQWVPAKVEAPDVPRIWGPPLAVITVPTDAPPCALWTVVEAWELLHPRVPVLVEQGDFESDFARIVVHWAPPSSMTPPNPDALGVTIQAYSPGLGIGLHSDTWVNVCSVRLLAHELGHSMGLKDVDDPGSVMHWTYGTGGWRIDPDEREILDHTGEFDFSK